MAVGPGADQSPTCALSVAQVDPDMSEWREHLWSPQREALSTIEKYLRQGPGHLGPSALVRMPTGTGKALSLP